MARILLVAAEASSVLYAERLMDHWTQQGILHDYFGVGSKTMEGMGFRCLGYAEEMAVMGFSEVLQHYFKIKSVFDRILEEVRDEKPSVAILLDYPGFNLKLSKELHRRGVPVVYYISPQVWAWKKKRVKLIQAYVTKMLVVFPFEFDFYKEHHVDVGYVGHPLLDELKDSYFDLDRLGLLRSRLGISAGHKVLGLMPGSRKQEVEKHLSIQLKVAEMLTGRHPNLKVILMVAPTLSKEYLRDQLEDLRVPVVVIQDEPFSMISLADAVLAASGTATLMVGLLEKPMIIMYRMSWISAFIGRRLVKGFFGLVNIISKREVVPEIFQERAVPSVLEPLVERALFDEKYRATVQSDLKVLRESLGPAGVTARVASSVESVLHGEMTGSS